MITHAPDDLIVTVTAEVTLAALQAELAQRGQWLPVDPPGGDQLTVRSMLDTNASGPHRFGFGTVREHLLGLQVTLPDGRSIKAGGQVVKNVAGYDLCKLFVGARGTLGTIREATFKLWPRPEAEQIVQNRCDSLAEADRLIEIILASDMNPVVLDLVGPATVVAGFAGNREEVDWQLAKARALGLIEPATLAYDRAFAHTLSVLPSTLVETIRALNLKEFVARAGNGVIGMEQSADSAQAAPAEPQRSVRRLEQRLEEAFGARR